MSDAIKQPTMLRPISYWWLWVLDTVLVTGAFLFFLATRYGTYEFFGKALLMALLPLIPVMVLVGGAGSTVFALTKVWIEKRRLKRSVALALLVGQAAAVAMPLVGLGLLKSPPHRLAYICAGYAPVNASGVTVVGYKTFLREEWLAVFVADPEDFQSLAAAAKLVPTDSFEVKAALEKSSLSETRPFRDLPAMEGAKCFKRVFNEREEHERGRIFAVFDAVTGKAAVFREFRD